MSMQATFVPPSTAAELLNANLNELKYWAREINKASLRDSRTKPIKNLSLPKDDLMRTLADHLGIDLSAPAVGQPSNDGPDIKPVIPPSVRESTRRQYEFCLALGRAWANQEPYAFSLDGEQPLIYHPLLQL